jgi:hypothetical protein
MANENTPINTRQDSTKHGSGDQPTQKPAGDPKREDEQKTAPPQHEKNEPVRK